MIFEEFGLNPKEFMIINRHVPVKNIKRESPINANGKVLAINDDFAKVNNFYKRLPTFILERISRRKV